MDAAMDALARCATEPLPSALLALGGLYAAKCALRFLGTLYRYFLRPPVKFTKLGKWAVVTGATDGIGKAYALALAKQGMSIVLISRTEAKLQAVAAEIDAKRYPGLEKTKYIVCDYSKFEGGDGARVAEELAGLDVGVLVNNVGMSYRYPRFFHELPYDEVGGIMAMNVASTVWTTKIVLEGMVDRKRGTIVNLSSGSAEHVMPLLAEYGAAKMFVARFSESLDAEYRGRGVRVSCQVPFYVATKLAKLRKSVTVPTPEEYVAKALRWVGHGGVVQPFWLHGIQGWAMKVLPSFLVDAAVMSMHAGIRKRGLKKDAKLATEKAEGKSD